MKVRAATLKDLEAVHVLECECMALPWSREQVAAELNRADGVRLVVEDQHEISGYLFMMLTPPEAELLRIGVASARQHKGIGSLLLQEGLATMEASGVERCFLEVRKSNRAARSLYQKAGFVQIGIRPRYYKEPPEDAVIMQRQP